MKLQLDPITEHHKISTRIQEYCNIIDELNRVLPMGISMLSGVDPSRLQNNTLHKYSLHSRDQFTI